MTSIKMSEAGIIPEDWSVIQVRDIGKIKNGINKPKEAFGSGTPFVNLMDVFGKSTIGTATPLELLETTKTERNTYDLKAGDVLFIRSSVKPSGVGLTTLVKQDLPDTVFSGFLLRFRDSGNLDVSFKEHCFHAGYFRNSLIVNSTVSANTNINQSALGRLWLIVPPLPEQQAIAAALSDADGVVAGLERVIGKKRLIKQGAMQDLLTARRRLPGFSGEWEDVPLGGIGPFVGGGTPSMARPDYWKDGTIPWVSSSDIRIGILNGAERLISEAAVKGSSTRVVDPGAILFVTRSGILRRFQPVMTNTMPVAINQDIKALLPRSSDYLPIYVFHAAVASGDQIIRDCMKTGTTVESIDLGALRRFTIRCPTDIHEQKAIATVLSDMDAEIQTLESRLSKARAVKEGMMQNLLTGRVRLV